VRAESPTRIAWRCVSVGPPSDPQRRSTLRGELPLERGELGRLRPRNGARTEVARQWLQQRGRCANRQGHEQRRRCSGDVAPRSNSSAWIPATARPVAAYAAMSMCNVC
jgi:hypothetical protein